MSLDRTHDELGWPSREQILNPQGAGPGVIVQLAKEKIGQALSRFSDAYGVNIGILAADPEATEAPLAIVCEFPRKVSERTLEEAHKLAWNFGRAPLLITIEPHLIRKWSCYELPIAAQYAVASLNHGLQFITPDPEIKPPIQLENTSNSLLSDQAAYALQWVDLLNGKFFETYAARFEADKRADQSLLSNLRDVRQRLMDDGLDDDTSHDLLARIIFVQFLFDRKDSDGKAALNEEELRRLHERDGILSQTFTGFSDILNSYEDAYALFQWLNVKFNGDLFPGKGDREEQRAAWDAEKEKVKPQHLSLLAQFVSGSVVLSSGQISLWPYYAFDAIPLDFISTIYETFVQKGVKSGVHYTPAHIADLVLDSVLPWNSENWDLKILDPACGSGVFLVKAYQRLIHRWENAHPGQQIPSNVLVHILEKNLFGVDLDKHAVRVASFSLYLAMCDKINPRDYWKDVHFPILRGRRLVDVDFFTEEQQGIHTSGELTYDLVIGNPPWGRNSATALAKTWESASNWSQAYGDIGPLFFAKALELTKPGGWVGMLQPANILYKRTSGAVKFRERLFRTVQVEEIINFSALRFVLFQDAVEPACALTVRKLDPNNEPFWYTAPKPLHSQEDRYRIVIEPQDTHQVWPYELLKSPWISSTFAWGGRRDLVLIDRLLSYTNISKLEDMKTMKSKQGIKRSTRGYKRDDLLERRILEANDFSSDFTPQLDALKLPVNQDPYVHRNMDFSAFDLPQLIIKKSWIAEGGRFRASLVASEPHTGGVICREAFLSVHTDSDREATLEAACLVFNSIFAVYFLLLTSGRFAMYRPEPEVDAFRQVPLPRPRLGLIDGITTVEQVDQRVREAFDFQEAEWLLIEDMANFTLPDFKGDSNSPGRQPTHRLSRAQSGLSEEVELKAYCGTFLKVLHAAYGDDKHIGAVIYTEPPTEEKLPVRLISFYLNDPAYNGVQVEVIQSVQLRQRLIALYQAMLSAGENSNSFYQRCARTYDTVPSCDGQPAILINVIKPDQIRYWIRSMALQDADEVATDMMAWSSTSAPSEKQEAFVG